MEEQSEVGAVQQVTRLPVGLIAGTTYPLRALFFLKQTPQLWGFVVIPILVNLVIGVALYFGLLFPGWQFIQQWGSGLPTWSSQWIATLPPWLNHLLIWLPTVASVMDDILRWLLAIVLLITLGLLLVQFGAIFGAPWYGSLAEQIEKQQMGSLPSGKPTLIRALQDIGRAITFQLKKLGVMVLGALLLFLIGWMPFGSAIASIGWIGLGAILVCLDFLDPPLERRRFSFRRKLGIVGRTLPASASFGLACLGLVSIPLLNLLAVPVCVIAGTLFCCDRVLPDEEM
ncbi:EI24 domain-containing protein [Kovacikia minuta CCNUW1]|uniref:EI24 domain-containing protein n=1 Tax=Kovacikia minuta TaxID=2931930 RepID=UPI001CC9374E|nr:EI24 domain-containing protein [Kovacikia minuta]UBF25862.1 EI24 domain-containing protein [Kovacikia minuta CCNUW1]